MSGLFRSRVMWVCAGFLVIAGFFLITEHAAHTFGVLPYVLLLACPLLHMLSHRGHGGHGRQGGEHVHTTTQEKEGIP